MIAENGYHYCTSDPQSQWEQTTKPIQLVTTYESQILVTRPRSDIHAKKMITVRVKLHRSTSQVLLATGWGGQCLSGSSCSIPQQAQTFVCSPKYKIQSLVPSSINLDPSLACLFPFLHLSLIMFTSQASHHNLLNQHVNLITPDIKHPILMHVQTTI